MMEKGKAHIANKTGYIDTDTAPSPVYFAPGSFPGVVNDMDVAFKRASPGLDWASVVVPALSVASLIRIATPSSGLTREAIKLLHAHAFNTIASVNVAPTPTQGRKHLALAKRKMLEVAALSDSDRVPIGVAAVKKALR